MLQVEDLTAELMLTMRSILNFATPKHTEHEVINTVINSLNVDIKGVMGTTRTTELVEARVIISAILYSDGLNPTEISSLLGAKHRSTVYYHLDKYEAMVDTRDSQFLAKLRAVQPNFSWINLELLPTTWKRESKHWTKNR